MDERLRAELIEMARAEDAMRADTASGGDVEVVGAAHHELTALRREHDARLREIVDAHGWPGAALVGADGCEAAWRLAMFAVDDRDLQARCLALMEDLAEEGEVEPYQPAFLLDRLLVGDGKQQVYGSQFSVSADGVEPFPISDPGGVDARRSAIGVEPLAAALERMRKAHGAG